MRDTLTTLGECRAPAGEEFLMTRSAGADVRNSTSHPTQGGGEMQTMPAEIGSGRYVALFVPSLAGGGAEKVMINLAGSFVRRGIRVDLILLEKRGPYLPLVPPGVRVIDFAATSQPLTGFSQLTRYMRRERPDVLIAALKQATRIAPLAKQFAGRRTRVVVTLHGVMWEPDKRVLYRLGRRLVYHWADEIVAVSAGVADDFSRFSLFPRERVKVIYNPVVSPELRYKAREMVRHEWFSPGQPQVILSAGRLIKEKDYETLIRAFALVRERRPARLLILGEGAERASLQALVEELNLRESVAMPGFVENPYAYMARAALFVLSSSVEGLPNVLIEALAVGTSVVSTDCESGPREILDSGKYGTLVPVGDAETMATAIENRLDAPYDREMLRLRADEFDIERIASRYLDVAGVTLEPQQ